MIEIARSHSEKKILESLQKLYAEIHVGPGKLSSVEVDDASSNHRPRTISVTVDYTLTPDEFTQILDDSLEDPKPGRKGVIL